MNPDRLEQFSPASGEEFRPATVKLWGMLIVFAMMVPVGAVMSYCWWYQLVLPGGRVLSAKAGVVGLLGVPLAVFLVAVMAALIATAKRLVIGENCVQLLSKDRVVVHIPFQNMAQIGVTGDKDSEKVVFVLRDRNDPATLVPLSTKDRYEIQCMIYGKPPGFILQTVSQQHSKYSSVGG